MLPVGTIVILKKGIKPLMISGYLVKDINGKEKDYVGIPYPEGIISKDSLFSFNKEDIDKVIYKGYENILYRKFIDNLSENSKNI